MQILSSNPETLPDNFPRIFDKFSKNHYIFWDAIPGIYGEVATD